MKRDMIIYQLKRICCAEYNIGKYGKLARRELNLATSGLARKHRLLQRELDWNMKLDDHLLCNRVLLGVSD